MRPAASSRTAAPPRPRRAGPLPPVVRRPVARRPRPPRSLGAQAGQASVELVALLPCIAALFAALWQLALAGHAAWAAAAAARAAARAHALGADPRRAARDHLPRSLEPGLRVRTAGGDEVEIAVRIPALPGLPSPGRTHATARFTAQ